MNELDDDGRNVFFIFLTLIDGNGGIVMSSHSRAALMLKLQRGDEIQKPQTFVNPALYAVQARSTCIALRNMFDPRKYESPLIRDSVRETEPNWHVDIKEDVLEEVSKVGKVIQIMVDKHSIQGNVFIRMESMDAAEAVIAKFNNRFFASRCLIVEYVHDSVFAQTQD